MPDWLKILITAGVFTALIAAMGRIFVQILKENSAKRTRVERRAQDLEDKKLQRRREAYAVLLEEINASTIHQLNSGADRPLTSSELQQRAKMMRDIDLYGSDEVKRLSVYVAGFLKRDLKKSEHPLLIQAVQQLSQRMREELGE